MKHIDEEIIFWRYLTFLTKITFWFKYIHIDMYISYKLNKKIFFYFLFKIEFWKYLSKYVYIGKAYRENYSRYALNIKQLVYDQIIKFNLISNIISSI